MVKVFSIRRFLNIYTGLVGSENKKKRVKGENRDTRERMRGESSGMREAVLKKEEGYDMILYFYDRGNWERGRDGR